MLKEFSARQTQSAHLRRYLTDEYFDLFVWQDADGKAFGFQLCYDKPGYERALTWMKSSGFSHMAVDAGENIPNGNRTPILTTDKDFPAGVVRREFAVRAYGIDPRIQDLVLTKIDEYTASKGPRTLIRL